MMKYLLRVCLLALCLSSIDVLAEDLVSQGISGDMDAHSRSPILTVSTEKNDNNVKILADAFLQTPEFRKYPLRFDFFINRRLFSSQFRSPELPGAVGVDIGPDIAVPPFNYAVVVEVLHPNRNFTSVVQGAVYQGEAPQAYSCIVRYSDEESTIEAKDENVDLVQTDTNTYSITFNDEENDLRLTGSIIADAEKYLTAKILNSKTNETVDMHAQQNYELNTFALISDDGNLTFSCNKK